MKIFCIFTSLKLIKLNKSEIMFLTILTNSLTIVYGF